MGPRSKTMAKDQQETIESLRKQNESAECRIRELEDKNLRLEHKYDAMRADLGRTQEALQFTTEALTLQARATFVQAKGMRNPNMLRF